MATEMATVKAKSYQSVTLKIRVSRISCISVASETRRSPPSSGAGRFALCERLSEEGIGYHGAFDEDSADSARARGAVEEGSRSVDPC